MTPNLFQYIWRISRTDQIAVLLMVLVSMPFYFISLDIPKRIVNDALQGRAFADGAVTAPLFGFEISLPDALGGFTLISFPGFAFEQLSYLFALCGLFLAFVVINGLFKLFINLRKGILGEQILRHMRYDLFELMMRQRPEEIRSVKPAEASSMIRSEVEPIGGFSGDAFIQPAFLGAKALTALAFIVVQNVWLGLVSLVVVLVQALFIPRLRKRLIELGRQRQIESRKLAGQIGSAIEAAPAIQGFGSTPYVKSTIWRQLQTLLAIRISLFQRKFAVKFLNNFLAQVTPFFFYTIGGYFALTGRLDMGQLLAVIVAYRDLPPPIKELIDWDQQRNDISVKFEQVCQQVLGKKLLPEATAEHVQLVAKPDLTLKNFKPEGVPDTFNLPRDIKIGYGQHVAFVGSSQAEHGAVARAIGRQIPFSGDIEVGGQSLNQLSSEDLASMVNYVGTDSALVPGSIRGNILMAVRHVDGPEDEDAADVSWINFQRTGVETVSQLDRRIIEALEMLDVSDDLYRFGLQVRGTQLDDTSVYDQLLNARHVVHEELREQGLIGRIEIYDPERYHENSTIGENLLFGVPVAANWQEDRIGRNRLFNSALRTTEIHRDLLNVGEAIAENSIEMLADLPPNHPFFERYSLVEAQDIGGLSDRLEQYRSRRQGLTRGNTDWLIELALRYCEERHRFDLVDESLARQIVETRQYLHSRIVSSEAGAVEFFNPDEFNRAATLQENLLFGRTRFGLPKIEQQIVSVAREILAREGLDNTVRLLGLDFDVGPGGRLISMSNRAAINIARCLINTTPIVVLDNALQNFPPSRIQEIAKMLRREMAGRTLIFSTDSVAIETLDFDAILSFKDGTTTFGKLVHDPEPANDMVRVQSA